MSRLHLFKIKIFCKNRFIIKIKCFCKFYLMTFAFNYKVKTRGLILAVNNCGIIAGAREMFGAESLSQMAQLYLDIVDNIEGVI